MPEDIPEEAVLFYEEIHNDSESPDALAPYLIDRLSFYRDGLVRAEHENESSSEFGKQSETRISPDKIKKLVVRVAEALVETFQPGISGDYNPSEDDTKYRIRLHYNSLEGELNWLLSQKQFQKSSIENMRLQLSSIHTLVIYNRGLDKVLNSEGVLERSEVSEEDELEAFD